MASTLLRLGFWILILVLALYVAVSEFGDQEWAHLIPTPMLQQALGLSILLILAGIAARILGKGVSAVAKNRCRVCRTPVPSGAIYCRAHLRAVLYEEDEKTHSARVPKR
jgi:hypothetical protein